MDTNSKVPLYYQLVEVIEANIKNGTWKKGNLIPSERELTQLYNVSRITVRSAINELAKVGKLEKVQGKGTYVICNSIIQNLGNIYSFSKEMEKQGEISSTQLVNQEVILADYKLAHELNVEEGSKVIRIVRLRCANDNVPIMLEKTYFPLEGYQFLMDIDLNRNSLYKTLENDYGVVFSKAIETFKACELNNEECMYLNCKKKQYGLLVKRTSYIRDAIVCYSTIVSKGDIFEFTVKLTA